MIEGDEVLFDCNETELLWMTRVQGLPILRRGIPKEELVAIVAGKAPNESHLAWTNTTRGKLEDLIQANISRLSSALPGCTGMCRTYLCTEEKHMSCFLPHQHLLL
jgi:hypothetical protein